MTSESVSGFSAGVVGIFGAAVVGSCGYLFGSSLSSSLRVGPGIVEVTLESAIDPLEGDLRVFAWACTQNNAGMVSSEPTNPSTPYLGFLIVI